MEWGLTQLILHSGQRLVVRGHCQSLQLISLGKSLPLIGQHQPRLRCRRGAYLKCPPCVTGEAVTWTLHYTYYIRPSQGFIAALSSMWKQTQGGCQNMKTKKHEPSEGMEQNSRRRTKRNGDKRSAGCRAQNTGYKDAQ